MDVECAAVIASRFAPTVVRVVRRSWMPPQIPVGASLLAKAVGRSESMLNVPPSSRAGSLPQ
ncbi:hypothetical protein CF597_10220 [Pseudomonas sp. PSB1]|nr:hypothetical protein [Pseudomonas sp. PSB1]